MTTETKITTPEAGLDLMIEDVKEYLEDNTLCSGMFQNSTGQRCVFGVFMLKSGYYDPGTDHSMHLMRDRYDGAIDLVNQLMSTNDRAPAGTRGDVVLAHLQEQRDRLNT